jgi:4-carboxymuconolactone decarboxylase
MPTPDDVRMVAPALERYQREVLVGDLWKRPGLSPRDRSLVTVAALIARNQATEMPFHFSLALDNGVTPGELSEVITHLAFYAGWGNAMSAVAVAKDVFGKRGIGADQLPPASGPHLPVDEAAESRRAASVDHSVGPVAPGLVQYTSDVLFHELWLRPALAPRDRSLVTVSALIAAGQVAQVPFHLNRAMDHGLTQAQAAEVITHLAFYAGWPNAMSAVPVARDVFEKRPQSGSGAHMGTWRLNEAKSTFSPGAPKVTTVVFAPVETGVKATIDGVDAEGRPAHNEWTGKFDGNDYPAASGPAAGTRAYRSIDDRTLEFTSKSGGSITLTGRIVVAADGRSCTVTESGMDAKGRPFSITAVFDKQ